MDENDIALIDQFLSGELASLERVQFEKRVKSDLEFAKEVRLQQKVVDSIRVLGASRMVASVKSDFAEWKNEGHTQYKPPSGGNSWLKFVIGGVVIAGAVVAYMMYGDLIMAPAPTEPEVEENLVKLKTTEEEVADLKLDVKDVSTFQVHKLDSVGPVYSYEIKYDGTTRVVKTKQPDLDQVLKKMAVDSQNTNEIDSTKSGDTTEAPIGIDTVIPIKK